MTSYRCRFASPGLLLEETAKAFGISVDDLMDCALDRKNVLARQTAMYILREVTGLSYPQIGWLFERDHTTVLYSVRQIEKRIKVPYFRGMIHGILEAYGGCSFTVEGVKSEPELRAIIKAHDEFEHQLAPSALSA
jgi:hypothetical protein